MDKKIDINTTVGDVTKSLADQQEAYLRDFFGTLENAETFAKYVVIEEHPVKIISSTDEVDGSVRLMFRQVFILRMATDEERQATENASDTSE